ncbi:signal peptidase II [Saccharophagus degradans]|uniref:Lipoprotein signal peptidase n=1 Tax=Saccharophagus degradans TaxID=86304 RepID=A0AAW7XAX1_9GAMM|nr:signal peptidase II [Saccharophagus degradans]MDO6424679.1 signal peptidase II [Saccharophagus degradans]MDO6609012.1 signal peptidase II [Saccharophagus degradans]
MNSPSQSNESLNAFLAKSPWVWYAIAFVVIVLDQITKQIAEAQLLYNQPVEITGFFNFTLRYNPGAAFSMFADWGGAQRWGLGALAAGVSVAITIWIAKLDKSRWTEALALALVLGGAIGNLYDRMLLGHVIDFIEVHGWGYYFPAFNIADSAITVGAGILIYDALFIQPKLKKTADA